MSKVKLAFDTLSADEFEGMVNDAQQLKDQNTALSVQVEELQKQLAAKDSEFETLKQEREREQQLAALTQDIAMLRNEAEALLRDGDISAFRFSQYFGKALDEDVTKFGSDAIEYKVAQRFVAASKEEAKNNPKAAGKAQFQTFATGGSQADQHKSLISGQSLAV